MEKENEVEKKGFSIKMPLAYHQKLKLYAIHQNKTMSQVVLDLIKEKVTNESKTFSES
ncbi:MAG: hypothetical protein Q8O92_12880 [Candidatus Latescibacter sp.]|nr:hypothetical protein [Candidatus Latescibacter sp.]